MREVVEARKSVGDEDARVEERLAGRFRREKKSFYSYYSTSSLKSLKLPSLLHLLNRIFYVV
jgi:hypothetical protein